MAAPVANALGGDIGGSADRAVGVAGTAVVVADGARGAVADIVCVPLWGCGAVACQLRWILGKRKPRLVLE